MKTYSIMATKTMVLIMIVRIKMNIMNSKNWGENQNEYNEQQKLRNFPIKIDNETSTHAEIIKDISKDVPKDLNHENTETRKSHKNEVSIWKNYFLKFFIYLLIFNFLKSVKWEKCNLVDGQKDGRQKGILRSFVRCPLFKNLFKLCFCLRVSSCVLMLVNRWNAIRWILFWMSKVESCKLRNDI